MRGKPIHWTLYGLCGYVVALGVQFLLMPPDWGCAETMVPYFATPLLMLFFGPYLLVPSNEVCFCGVDDPTFIFDIWYKQLARADESSRGAPLRILLSHRPERPDAYAKYDFDLVVTGHAHGGQWRLPSVNRGTYSPDQHFFPKYADGVYALPNGKPMLVGRGLARESSPVPRFFNHPHVLIVDLIS